MLRSIMLLLVLFILGCATTVTRTDGERPIQCTITSAATFKIGDSVVITWALVNNTDKAMYFLDWATPFDTIRGMLTGKSFLVLRNGEPVTYTGTLVRRNGPSERDYYMVASGSSASIGIDLAKSYDMGDPGEAWATNPGYMVDGNLSNFASTTVDGDVELCEGNTYSSNNYVTQHCGRS